jgi:hypothetical protein
LESIDGLQVVLSILFNNKLTELTITDLIVRVHRENDGRIIIEIPEVDQNYLTELLAEDMPVRITVEKLGTNSWMVAGVDYFENDYESK